MSYARFECNYLHETDAPVFTIASSCVTWLQLVYPYTEGSTVVVIVSPDWYLMVQVHVEVEFEDCGSSSSSPHADKPHKQPTLTTIAIRK